MKNKNLMVLVMACLFSMDSQFSIAQGGKIIEQEENQKNEEIEQQSEVVKPTETASSTEQKNDTESKNKTTKTDNKKNVFIPSEEISEDKPVTFPVDI